jgi:alpha-galactosidase
VIAIDQDPLGKQGDRVVKDGDLEVWSRPLKDGGRAVVLLNRSDTSRNIKVSWEDVGYPHSLTLHIRDLWRHKDLTPSAGGFEAPVASHGVVMLKLGL